MQGAVIELGWEAWLTLGVLVVMVLVLVRDIFRPDLVLLGALGALLLGGVVTPAEAFGGFANSAVLTVGALYVVAAGVQRTNALAFLDDVLFSRSSSTGRSLIRLMLPTAALSAFINNTPIVAMLIPRVQQWTQQQGRSASKYMIPLSYAAIVGGMTTLIGTSTNLVVSGLLEAEGYAPLGMFDLAWIGLPVAVVVLVYFVLIGYRLLPDRQAGAPAVEEELPRFLFEVMVAPYSPLVGQTIDEADLRALGEAYLVHVRREDNVLQANPELVLQPGDVLTFTGATTVLDDMLRRTGLMRAVPPLQADGYATLPLYEAIVSDSSELVGKTLREADFREKYQGVVLGIQRKNEQVRSPLGRTPIKAGDLLLVEAPTDFEERWGPGRSEFYLVAPRRPGQELAHTRRAPLALAIMGSMVVVAATGLLPIVTAAFGAALAMIVTGCLYAREAESALNLQVLFVIAAALGIGQAVGKTGLAGAFAHNLLSVTAPLGTVAVLAALYVATNLLTELITNNAAAALMVPVAVALAPDLGIGPRVIGILVAGAASASFMTPIGYQTNLMVMAPGGYRFGDYLRAGLPVSLLVMIVAVLIIALLWV